MDQLTSTSPLPVTTQTTTLETTLRPEKERQTFYEKIVKSPEQEVKKMISFCNLDWEPDCLNFYKNKKTPVQTVSVSQANRPIYKTSVNSNEKYVKYLSEMFNILDSNL